MKLTLEKLWKKLLGSSITKVTKYHGKEVEWSGVIVDAKLEIDWVHDVYEINMKIASSPESIFICIDRKNGVKVREDGVIVVRWHEYEYHIECNKTSLTFDNVLHTIENARSITINEVDEDENKTPCTCYFKRFHFYQEIPDMDKIELEVVYTTGGMVISIVRGEMTKAYVTSQGYMVVELAGSEKRYEISCYKDLMRVML